MGGKHLANIIFFASDISEISQYRRIESLREAGAGVRSTGFAKRPVSPDWPHQSLGRISESRLGARALRLLAALLRLWSLRGALGQADLVIARNLDMALLALAARALAGVRVPILYECLDIHGVFIGRGLRARLARWVERRVLARISALITSSPGFVIAYFAAEQGYCGPVEILENKLALAPPPPVRPAPATRQPGPLRLGWVGALRCRPSLTLLAALARALPERVEIHIAGKIHAHAIPDFEALIDAPNIHFSGAYAYPRGLERVYGGVDLVWAQDLWQRGANSDWLLPNRIYEASWFGCPSLAVAGTETGRKVAREGLGYVIDEARPEDLIAAIEGFDPNILALDRALLLARPPRAFAQSAADLAPILAYGKTQERAEALA